MCLIHTSKTFAEEETIMILRFNNRQNNLSTRRFLQGTLVRLTFSLTQDLSTSGSLAAPIKGLSSMSPTVKSGLRTLVIRLLSWIILNSRMDLQWPLEIHSPHCGIELLNAVYEKLMPLQLLS